MEEVNTTAVQTPKVLASFWPEFVLPILMNIIMVDGTSIIFHINTATGKTLPAYPAFLQRPGRTLQTFQGLRGSVWVQSGVFG